MLVSVCVRSFYVWEILHSTIRKMNKQVTSQQVMLEEAKDKLEAAKRKLKVSRSTSRSRSLKVLGQ